MRFSDLEEFIELARRLNYTKAAFALGVTQSALSKHIAAMEKELGARLFDRTSKGAELTAEGKLFLEEALSLVRQFNRAKQKLRRQGGDPVDIVAGGNITSNILSVVAKTVRACRKDGIALQAICSESMVKTPLEMLESGDVDLIITHFSDMELANMDRSHVNARFLFNDPFVIVVEDENPLAQRDSVRVADLVHMPLVHLSGNYFFSGWGIIAEACHAAGFEPNHQAAFAASTRDFPNLDLSDSVLVITKGLLADVPFMGMPPYRAFVDEGHSFPVQIVTRTENDGGMAGLFADRVAEMFREMRDERGFL